MPFTGPGYRCSVHGSAAARPSASARGYGSEWRKRRARWLALNPWCVVCGAPATDVDHVIRKRVGGADDESNLQSLCHAHHSAKTAREVGFRGRPVG